MKLVVVDWIDSCSSRGWVDKESLQMSVPLPCSSVGWLLKEDKECIVIIPHISDTTEDGDFRQGSGDITIPKVAIKRIVEIRVPRK